MLTIFLQYSNLRNCCYHLYFSGSASELLWTSSASRAYPFWVIRCIYYWKYQRRIKMVWTTLIDQTRHQSEGPILLLLVSKNPLMLKYAGLLKLFHIATQKVLKLRIENKFWICWVVFCFLNCFGSLFENFLVCAFATRVRSHRN